MNAGEIMEALREANQNLLLLKLELTRAENRAEDLQRELDKALS